MTTISSQVPSLDGGVKALPGADKRRRTADGHARSGFGEHLVYEEVLSTPLDGQTTGPLNMIRNLPASTSMDGDAALVDPLAGAKQEGSPAPDGLSQPIVLAEGFGMPQNFDAVVPEVVTHQSSVVAVVGTQLEEMARSLDRLGASGVIPGVPSVVPAPFPSVAPGPSVGDLVQGSAEVISVTSLAFHRPIAIAVRPSGQGADSTIDVVGDERPPAVERNGAASGRSWSVADFETLSALEAAQQSAAPGKYERTMPQTLNTFTSSLSGPTSAKSGVAAFEVDASAGSAVTQQISSAFETLLSGDIVGEEVHGGAPLSQTFTYQPKLRVLDIVLQPEDLGRVSIKMRLSGSGLSVTLEAENGGTRQLLQQEAGPLSERLVAEGYDVESFSVQQLSVASPTSAKEISSQGSADAFRGAETGPDQGKGQARGQGGDAQHSRHQPDTGHPDANGPEDPKDASIARKYFFV